MDSEIARLHALASVPRLRGILSFFLLIIWTNWGANAGDLLTAEERVWLQQKGKLTCLSHASAAPFEVRLPDGTRAGITTDLVQMLSKRLGVPIIPIGYSNWTDSLKMLEEGKIDFLGTFSETPERLQRFRFTRPYLFTPTMLFVRRGGAEVVNLDELRGKRVGTIEGYAAHAWIKQHHPDLIITPVPASQAGMRLLASGEIDAMFDTLPAGRRTTTLEGLINVRYLPTVYFWTPQQMAVSRTNTVLASILQKGLDSIPYEDRQRVALQYGEPEISASIGRLPEWFGRAAAVAGILAAATFMWIFLLRRQVAFQTDSLSRSEQRYRTLVDSSPDAIVAHREGKVVYSNQSAMQLFGIADPSDAQHLTIFDMIDKRDQEEVREQIEAVTSRKKSLWRGKVRVHKIDGTPMVVEGMGSLIDLQDGPAIQVVLRDVTEPQQTENLIAGQNRMLEMIASGTPLNEILRGLVEFVERESGRCMASILLVDPDSSRISGGHSPSLPPEFSRAILDAKIGPCQASSGTAAFRRETVVVFDIADDPLWSGYRELAMMHGLRACTSQPVLGSKGGVLGTFSLYFKEPTAPTQYEFRLLDAAAAIVAVALDRERAESTLREKERFISTIAQNSPDYIQVFDLKNQRSVYRNKDLRHLFGYSSDEIEQFDRNGYAHLAHTEDQPRLAEHLKSITRLEDNVVRSIEYRLRTKDGAYRYLLARDTVLRRNEAGEAIEILSVTQDITEAKRAQENQARLEAQYRQSQKMEAIGQLAGGVAHDFNNLLTVVMANASVLAEDPNTPASARELGRQIRIAAERAADLTRQLLTFSRQQVMQLKPIDLNDVVNQLVKLLGRVVGEQISLEHRCINGPAPVTADRGMLEQVIMNLVFNARDAMPKGGRLTMSTRLATISSRTSGMHPDAREGRYVVLEVTDTGLGIPPENLPHIFEPFFTTKEIGRGTGLGLATVYGILQQHQGWIEVSSQPGQGSTFSAYLPLRQTPGEAAAEQAPSPQAVPGGNEGILLVEDEQSVRSLVQACLLRWGYEVFEASEASEALEIWKNHRDRIALLLTDMVMPGKMDGRELAQCLRQDRPDLKVVLSTGYSREILKPSDPSAKTERYLFKPYDLSALAQTLRDCLDEVNSEGSPRQ